MFSIETNTLIEHLVTCMGTTRFNLFSSVTCIHKSLKQYQTRDVKTILAAQQCQRKFSGNWRKSIHSTKKLLFSQQADIFQIRTDKSKSHFCCSTVQIMNYNLSKMYSLEDPKQICSQLGPTVLFLSQHWKSQKRLVK